MPLIKIYHTNNLPKKNALSILAKSLHHKINPIIKSNVNGFKTHIIENAGYVLASGSDDANQNALLTYDLAMLSGRSEETKQAVVALITEEISQFFGKDQTIRIQISVHVYDLDKAFHTFEL